MDIIFLAGESGSGKTTAALRCAQKAREANWRVGGVVAVGNFVNNVRHSFTLMDLTTGRTELLARRGLATEVRQGPFGFTGSGLSLGHQADTTAVHQKVDLVIIDEVGPLELKGDGWANDLRLALQAAIPHLLLTVRPPIVEEMAATFFPKRTAVTIPVAHYQKIFGRWNWQEAKE